MKEVERLLNSVGKNTFLLFYPYLKENRDLSVDDLKTKIDSKYQTLWNDDSWNTKVSKAKTIFKNKQVCDALYLCAMSAKRWDYLDD